MSITNTNLHDVIFQHTQKKKLNFQCQRYYHRNSACLMLRRKHVIGPRNHSLHWTLATSCRGRRNEPRKKCKFYFSTYYVRRCSRCMQQIHDFAAITARQRRPHFVLVPHPRPEEVKKEERNKDSLTPGQTSIPVLQFSLSVLFHQSPIMMNVPSTLNNIIN
jgi:hypothetical protein